MPGRISMDTAGTIESRGLKRAHDHDLEIESTPLSASTDVKPGIQTNVAGQTSAIEVRRNGHSTSEETIITPVVNGVHGGSNGARHEDEEQPPALDGSWRQGEQNKSLGVMMDRLAQQAFHDLNTVLDKMAEVEPDNEMKHSDGSASNLRDTSNTSLQRKRLILEFAKEQRDRFTKTLVLSDWSRNEAEMARLIDIKVWLDMQRFAHTNARHAVAQIKIDSVRAKMPNPNLEDAVELLATGGSARVPDLGYIPPPRLTASQLLQTLKNMNVALATRLNLHEDVPYHMQKYRIADGRVTFTIFGEFEVDLAIANEEPSSPFYFIDLRLSFSPAQTAFNQKLRGFIEGRVNQCLARAGLQGCYDFLHNFVLTHKINTLREQANELIAGKFVDCLKVESLRRNLVVQYWSKRPGSKSWILIGITSEDSSQKSSAPKSASISLTWYRDQVATQLEIEIDWTNLSLEKLLLLVIARHTESILANLHDRVRQQFDLSVVKRSRTSQNELAIIENALSLKLSQSEIPLLCEIDPFTGRYILTPNREVISRVQRRINRDAGDVVPLLCALACAMIGESISTRSKPLGWSIVADFAKVDARILRKPDTRQMICYRCSDNWGDNWVLVVTIGLNGLDWWIVYLDSPADQKADIKVRTITHHKSLSSGHEYSEHSTQSFTDLMALERLAVAEISLWSISKELVGYGSAASLHLPQSVPSALSRKSSNPSDLVSSSIIFSMESMSDSRDSKSWFPWILNPVRLVHRGFDECRGDGDADTLLVRHDLYVTLAKNGIRHLQACLTRRSDSVLAFNDTQGMAVKVYTKLGEPVLQRLRVVLERIRYRDAQVSMLKTLNYVCADVDLERLRFRYGEDSVFSATIEDADHDRDRIKLSFEPVHNPHWRIKSLLCESLNASSNPSSFQVWLMMLRLTFPLLSTFNHLETQSDLSKSGIIVHARNVCHYSLQYGPPQEPSAIDIILRKKQDDRRQDLIWLIDDIAASEPANSIPEEVSTALSALCQDKTDPGFAIGNKTNVLKFGRVVRATSLV